MGRILNYRQISFETTNIPLGRRIEAKFFNPRPDRDGSTLVTDLDEKLLVRWMMLCEPARRLLFETLGFAVPAFYQPEVVEPFYCPGEGDIDLILSRRQAPHESVAMECKRVKVEVINAEWDEMHKLQDAAKGVRQANKLHDKFGFHRTYLAIITAVEASQQTESNIPCRGLRSFATPDYGDSRTFKRIVEFPGRDDLRPDIGIVFIEIVQPSGIGIEYRAIVRVCVDHAAQPRTQAVSVTNRVETLLQWVSPSFMREI